jgi:peptide/nickel transport system substrate-binding protein
MRVKFFTLVSVLVVASVLLGACTPVATPTPEKVVQTVVVEGKPVEVVVTATPAPKAEEKKTEAPKISPQSKAWDTLNLIVGGGEPETLDPAWTYETAGSTTELNLYEGLVFFKREKIDEYIPALATEWTQSKDSKQWVFKIREGVKFHKGGTLEPHDVAYTTARAMLQGRIDGWQWILYEAFFGPDLAMASIKEFASAYTGKKSYEEMAPADLVKVCEDIKAKVVADDKAGTVTYNLNQPVPWLFPLMSQQFLGGIVDQEWMAEKGDWDGDCKTWTKFADPAAEKTILFKDANGTGPYMLDHWTPGEELVMVANPNYWRKEPMWEGGPSGVAKIPRVVIKNITEWGTRLSMFEAGDADYIYAPAQYRPQLNPQLKLRCGTDESSCKEENPNGYIKGFRNLPMPAITPAQFNWKISVEGGNPYIGSGKIDGNGIPPNFFSDIHIRKAFNYCFNYEAMVKDALAGEGVQAQGPLPMGMMGYLEGQKPLYQYNPEKCVEEFKLADLNGNGKSGDDDPDDIWKKGFYFQVAYNTGNDTRRLASEILKAGLEEVNPKFNLAVVGMPWPVLLESRRQGKLPIYVGGWVEDYHDPHNWANPFLYSQGAYGRIVNMPAEKQKEYDDLILKGASETDQVKRRAIYETIQKKAQDEAVNIWMYQALEGIHYQTWVNGFYFNPAYGNPEYGWVYAMSKQKPQ